MASETASETTLPTVQNWARARLDRGPTVVANLLICGVLGFAAWLQFHDRALYLMTVQEDQCLEWATFFSFVLSAVLVAVAARSQRRDTGRLPWFLLAVSSFCFVVAMEEISWGQRLFGYMPPTYFLAHNNQQELNLHNLAKAALRSVAFNGILIGYGVLLPVFALASRSRAVLSQLAVVAPPIGLVPSFLAAAITWNWYPLQYTGEWVELMMGLGFTFAGLGMLGGVLSPKSQGRRVVEVAASFAGVVALGFVAATASDVGDRTPALHDRTQTETVALMTDLLKRGAPCKGSRRVLQRVFTYVDERHANELYQGEFAALRSSGLSERRAQFFLDPWNSPYWIYCTEVGNSWTGLVYSFGPNRRRETSGSTLGGDDIGAVVSPTVK